MKCTECKVTNPEEALYCQYCGQALKRVCASCGASNAPEAKFCMQCGSKLDAVSEDDHQAKLKSLQKAVPRGLREKIREVGKEIDGERKPVTILFTDIVGSTSIAEKLDPEVWKEIVAGAHRCVGEAVYRYEGTIAQLLGDGVLAYFGAPLTHEDDPIRAAHAAMDIQESIRAYSQELANIVDNFQMRIGINTGTVVIGEISADVHVEYTAIGDAVNVAARLQSAAEPGKIVLSEPCARQIRSEFELKDLGEIKLKGKEKPLQIFELIGIKAEPKSVRGIEGFPTPYLGRAREVEKLESALLALCKGHGQIVTVTGDAGIGKTRLLEEVKATSCEGKEDRATTPISPTSIRWLEGRALSYGASLSYWTITQLLLADLGLSEGASQIKIKVALRKRVNALFDEKSAIKALPYLANLLGLKWEGEEMETIQSLDGEALKQGTLKAVADYFALVAEEISTVLVFEDMHWGDPSSMEMLEHLMPLTDRVPLMILMLMRIQRDHSSWEVKIKAETDFPHRFTELHLQRLSEGDSSSLLHQLIGATQLPEQIRHTIMERSEGNPFYLEEVVRHMMEQDLLVQAEAGWRMADGFDENRIPDTLQGVLLARIDQLEEDIRRTVQMASVIGKSFLYRILEAISEAEQQLDTHLSKLQRVDLIREKARIPELEYVFKHSLTQEAAYTSLLHKRRREFHLKVGEALEELFPDRVGDFLGLLAHHFETAEAWNKAVNYLQRAGDQARLTYAHKEAIDFYKRALDHFQDTEDHAQAARTLMKLGLTYHTAFDFVRSRQAYDQAFAIRQQEGVTPPETLQPAPHPFRLVAIPPSTLDINLSRDTYSHKCIRQIFSGLVQYGVGMAVIPDVARSWETAEDGTRYVFHLRDDVYWSDGVQVTAADFEYSWKRTLNPATKAPIDIAMLPYAIKNAQAYHKGEISDPDQVGVRAIDKLTLEVELESAASYFLHLLTMVNSFPVPEHVVEAYGDAWTDLEHIVSNGPFQLESYDPEESIRLVRNPTYHGEFPGNLESVEMQVSTPKGSSEELEMYEEDRLDIAQLGETTQRARHRFARDYSSIPAPTIFFLKIHNTNVPPFDDLRVRHAFCMALDKERLANEVFDGLISPATGGLVPPAIPGHSPEIGIKYDPSRARHLLEQAGYPGGEGFPTIELECGFIRKEVEYIQSQLKDNLNINVTIKVLKLDEFFYRKKDPPLKTILAGGWTADYPDPDDFLRVCIQGTLPYWRDERYERLLERAQRTLGQEERIRLYQQADKLLIEQAVLVPIVYYGEYLLCKPWVRPPAGSTYFWQFKHIIIEHH